MIALEEANINEVLAVGEITFAIPAQKFNVSCSISAEESLPVVTEFALRITFVCGSITPAQLQEFFGFSEKETAAVVKALLDERLIQWHEEELELTNYAKARFQDSSDNLPRFFKIQDWSSEVVFDLISFSPAERPARIHRTRSLIELEIKDADKQAKTLQWAEKSFQKYFNQICKKERADIYKISEVEAAERFSIPLPCVFRLNFDGQIDIRRDIDDASFGDRLEIAEAISDAMANQDRRSNRDFEVFVRRFDYEVLGKYLVEGSFDLRKYVHDLHVGKTVAYEDPRVTPILGALHLKKNAKILREWVRAWTKEEQADGEGGHDAVSGVWLGPRSSMWSRSRAAKDLIQDLHRLMIPTGYDQSRRHEVGIRTVVQERADQQALSNVYRDIFPRLFCSSQTVMDGDVEIFLIPDRFVCVLYHFHLAHHPITVPVGLISSHPLHVASATEVLQRLVFKSNVKLLHGSHTVEPFSAQREFAFLADSGKVTDGVKPSSSSGQDRPILSLKKKT
ncbi:hypothetical protein [Paraburkholderia tuberum]|uniref:Uncharacterized protein n=1 Tax=Paraburkholderia tuberum TaxID=157910 RepID=A0A1H1KLN4_9BURK|nr:hypothetical protein [Paraburkholderia tuberum]SDR62952.1 hypothetical protein SAMN05445850_8530 [Paraburkholderia tuberum]